MNLSTSKTIFKNEYAKPNSSYYNFLSMLFVTIMLGTYILAYKMLAFGDFVISGGIFIFAINYAITDIVSEVYGYEQTKKFIISAFVCCFLFAFIVPFVAQLPGPSHWPYQENYDYIFGKFMRFFIANTIGIIIGVMFNSYLIVKWKIALNGKHFWLRSMGSSAIGELLTSVVAVILAFSGSTEFTNVLKIVAANYSIKLFYSILLAIPSSMVVTHIKLKEGLDIEPKYNSTPDAGQNKQFQPVI